MFRLDKVKGIIFDYGGTIDSNGLHWAEVIRAGYEAAGIPVTEADFRDAYVHGERTLGKNRLVLPHHTFRDMLRLKTGLQFEWLVAKDLLPSSYCLSDDAEKVAEWCYGYARTAIERAKSVLERLAGQYPLVLVSNFYGNIETVLEDFGLDVYFGSIVESAVVGVRKPDPAIFSLGLEELYLPADETVVIGDSYDKDILPAASLGCQTVWLKNIGWKPYEGDETADAVIADFSELVSLFRLDKERERLPK